MKYRIAVGTKDGKYVTEHFGQCGQFRILEIDQDSGEAVFVENRETPHNEQCGDHRNEVIAEKIRKLKDCRIVLAKQIGGQSEKLLNHSGIAALQYGGPVEDALVKIKRFYKRQNFTGKE